LKDELHLRAFRRSLRQWGRRHFRAFPWRLTRNAYRILVAEVMLHRTQASQVLPVYERFIELYPDLPALANASSRDLHKVLRPLGLRWRVGLMLKMAREIVERFGGEVPPDLESLRSLPGVSHYIAAAVRCFAWDLPDALLDTNTVRVLARIHRLETRDSSRRSKAFHALATRMLDPDHPREYTFALLDLAESVCTARRPPACDLCPLQAWCNYARTRRQVLSRAVGV